MAIEDSANLNLVAGQPSFLLERYQALPGIYDELADAGGVRPLWAPLVAAFGQMGAQELERRFGFADRHLRDTGVVHRVYGDAGGVERPLPLSHVPLLVGQADWADIEAATIQRASLIEALLADIYGPQHLITDGRLPAALVAGSPEFLRPMVGCAPAGGAFLSVYAMDLGRGPDGRWWVLADRAEAPAGMGYTVENRIALSRAFPDLYQAQAIRRVAPFFRNFKDALNALSATGGRVGVLSAGVFNETSFEHAFLARYLGFLLLEGEDLVVRGDHVFVSTIAGLQPIDVLIRRLNSSFADPLQFNSDSWIGVPGLAVAAQAGHVVLANALGAGVVEGAGLFGHMPKLANALLGEDLKFPNVASWWCGDQTNREKVLSSLADYVIAPAFGPILPGLLDDGAVHMRDASADEFQLIAQAIETRGMDFVAQEPVQLSTMPVWNGRGLEARPFVLRVYAARTGEGWQVLPGGFCQVSSNTDPRAVSLQKDSAIADVWVEAAASEPRVTLVESGDDVQNRRRHDLLPSRMAENLFWLGRYVGRVESQLRLVRAMASRLVDFDVGTDNVIRSLAQLIENLRTGIWGSGLPETAADGPWLAHVLTDANAPGGLHTLVANAHTCAAKTRDRASPEAWTVLNDLLARAGHAPPVDAGTFEALSQCDQLLQLISAFWGLAHQNMSRDASWHFLQMGAVVERSINTVQLTLKLGDLAAPSGAFEALLELTGSQLTYRVRYSGVPSRPQIIRLVLLDAQNPRALAFQIHQMTDWVLFLDGIVGEDRVLATKARVEELGCLVRALVPEAAAPDALLALNLGLNTLSEAMTADFFLHHASADVI